MKFSSSVFRFAVSFRTSSGGVSTRIEDKGREGKEKGGGRGEEEEERRKEDEPEFDQISSEEETGIILSTSRLRNLHLRVSFLCLY